MKLIDVLDPILRKKSITIDKTFDLYSLIKSMNEIFTDHPFAVGIAAPQLGVNARVFMTKINGQQRVFVNPKIIKKFGSFTSKIEGCLSLPATTVNVSRHNNVYIEFYDENWIRHKEVFSDMLARVIQHEQDHLNGKLITDYL